MNIEYVRHFLLWSTIINYGVLIVWFLALVFFHNALYRLHGRWLHVSREQFDMLHYAGMSIYKIGILLLNLVPFVVLSVFD